MSLIAYEPNFFEREFQRWQNGHKRKLDDESPRAAKRQKVDDTPFYPVPLSHLLSLLFSFPVSQFISNGTSTYCPESFIIKTDTFVTEDFFTSGVPLVALQFNA